MQIDTAQTAQDSLLEQTLHLLDDVVLHDEQARLRSRDSLTLLGDVLRGTPPRCATRSRLLGALVHLRLQVAAGRDVDRAQVDLRRLLRAVRRHLGAVSA